MELPTIKECRGGIAESRNNQNDQEQLNSKTGTQE